jgi:hypothetical protein
MAMILVPIFIFILVIGALAFDICREESRARAVGMSETTPVCSQCHYPVGSWSSPKCPECGSDIRQVGVRTGPRISAFLFGMVILLMAFFVVAPLVAMATGWIFESRATASQVDYQSSSIPNLHVLLEAESSWRRWPPRDDFGLSIVLTKFLARPSGGSWINGRYDGPANRREQTVRIVNAADASNRTRIEQAIRQVVEPETNQTIVAEHAQALDTLSTEILESQSNGKFDFQFSYPRADGPLKSFGTVVVSSRYGSGWAPIVTAALAALATIWIGYRLSRKWCKSGWRLPKKREWEYSAARGNSS